MNNMETALIKKDKDSLQIMNVEDFAMTTEAVVKQVNLIKEVMEKTMTKGEHYGIIPGTKKPTLLKPGAEKLCLTFRFDPDYKIVREVREPNFIAYTVKCDLKHILSGRDIASGMGSCNTRESKYRWRYIEESTGKLLPKEYWKAREKGDSKEMARILGEDNRAAKIDGQWVIAKATKIENDEPWDLDNTIIKMACKRALVAASLNATAASDIFTQDLEDLPKGMLDDDKSMQKGEKTKKGKGSINEISGNQKRLIYSKMVEEGLTAEKQIEFYDWVNPKTTKEASAFMERFDEQLEAWRESRKGGESHSVSESITASETEGTPPPPNGEDDEFEMYKQELGLPIYNRILFTEPFNAKDVNELPPIMRAEFKRRLREELDKKNQ